MTKNKKPYYPKDISKCIDCYYARMRDDICGIYCTKGFIDKTGYCKKYKKWSDVKE